MIASENGFCKSIELSFQLRPDVLYKGPHPTDEQTGMGDKVVAKGKGGTPSKPLKEVSFFLSE